MMARCLRAFLHLPNAEALFRAIVPVDRLRFLQDVTGGPVRVRWASLVVGSPHAAQQPGHNDAVIEHNRVCRQCLSLCCPPERHTHTHRPLCC
jgi:hypothetical protein